jgi:hypothetical protein
LRVDRISQNKQCESELNDPAHLHASQFPSRAMSDPASNLRHLIDHYRMMARIRALKETALAAHKAGEIPILSPSR